MCAYIHLYTYICIYFSVYISNDIHMFIWHNRTSEWIQRYSVCWRPPPLGQLLLLLLLSPPPPLLLIHISFINLYISIWFNVFIWTFSILVHYQEHISICCTARENMLSLNDFVCSLAFPCCGKSFHGLWGGRVKLQKKIYKHSFTLNTSTTNNLLTKISIMQGIQNIGYGRTDARFHRFYGNLFSGVNLNGTKHLFLYTDNSYGLLCDIRKLYSLSQTYIDRIYSTDIIKMFSNYLYNFLYIL